MENLPTQYVPNIPQTLPLSTPKKQIVHQKFSPQEDEYLKQVVERIGTSDWAQVARAFNNSRTPRQCRERYRNYLAPGIVNGPWTDEEDQLLYQKYKALGPQWVKIAKLFPGRTDINVKNRWVTKFKKAEAGIFNPSINLDPQQIALQPPTSNYPELKAIPGVSEIPSALTSATSFLETKTIPTLSEIPASLPQMTTINLIPSSQLSNDHSIDMDKDVSISPDIVISNHLDEQK